MLPGKEERSLKMTKQVKNNGYRHNEEDILKACGLTKRDPVLRETFDFLVELINSTEGNSRRIELLEEFLKAKEYTAREKAFLLYYFIEVAYDSGSRHGAENSNDIYALPRIAEPRKRVGHA